MTKQSSPATPTMLLDFKKSRIRIHQQTLRLLGNPEYLRILVNPEEGILALQICEASDVRAHHAKPQKQPLELTAVHFFSSFANVETGATLENTD